MPNPIIIIHINGDLGFLQTNATKLCLLRAEKQQNNFQNMAPKCQLCHRISPVEFKLCLLRRASSTSLISLLLFNHVGRVQPPLHVVVHLYLLGCDVPRVLDDHDDHEVKRARPARSAVPAQLNGIPGSNLLQGAHSTVQDNTAQQPA